MAKIFIALVATLLVASSVQGGFHDLKNKLLHRYGHGGSAASANAYFGGSSYGGSSAAASAVSGNGFGGSSAAASAAATGLGGSAAGSSVAGLSPYINGGQQVVNSGYGQAGRGMYGQQQASMAGARASNYGNYGAAEAQASTQNNVYAQPPPAPMVAAPPMQPNKPNFDINQFKSQNGIGFKPYYGPGGVASNGGAAASSAVAGGAGSMASAAAAASGSYQQGGYTAPGTFSAASGTMAHNSGGGFEQRHSTNEVDNMENHEMGRADDDHYYNAKSYGKAADDNDHINYNKNFEDVMSSPTVFHSVKSTESLLRDHNKSQRESGSAVMAKDHHSAGYQKHQKHFHQNANSANVQSGAGGAAFATENDALNHSINDDDEMYFDSDGLNGGAATSAVGMATGYGQSAGASSAVRNAYGGGSVATSAALQGGFNGNYGPRFGGSAAAAAAVN